MPAASVPAATSPAGTTPSPAIPAIAAAPAKATAPSVATPVPTRPVPAIAVPAMSSAAPNILRFLQGDRFAGRCCDTGIRNRGCARVPTRRCGRHGCGHSRDDYQPAHVLLPKFTVSAYQNRRFLDPRGEVNRMIGANFSCRTFQPAILRARLASVRSRKALSLMKPAASR